MRILLTEDDPRLAGLLATGLARAGWAVDHVASAAEAEAALASIGYQAMLLDLGLPDGDGIDLLRSLRRRDPRLPVLLLTARARLTERVAGLNAGADDYLIKPVALEEVVARIAAACRRAAVPASTLLTLGRLCLEPATRRLTIDGVIQPLPRREMMVLELLLRAPENFVAKPRLETALSNFDRAVGPNAVEVYVSRLRRRLAALDCGLAIHTERGAGYRIEAA
ncbi:response regulator transcription factor [Roseomonas sp. 18066]|uniref:response regulator transcription factor n=1 Tax=Roseomonas sp. 18066 TaxID=2681412 RepID=UPI001356DE25|nr:response regulator transcription factor [Roseomonas sp. 18066]